MAAVADNLATRVLRQCQRGASRRRTSLRRSGAISTKAGSDAGASVEDRECNRKLLVLGGTGFIGSMICRKALQAGYSVVSVSRRGEPPGGISGDELARVDWRKGDACDPLTARDILQEYPSKFMGVIHAVGMLLESDLNAIASGSGSIPSPGAKYDDITRVTAFNAADAAVEVLGAEADKLPVPFVFVSAAEAKWEFKAPVAW